LRKWHGLLGAAMSLLIVVVCFSGLYLNHKNLFDGLLRTRRAEVQPVQVASLWGNAFLSDVTPAPAAGPLFSGRLTTASAPAALQSCLEQALHEAKDKWSDVPLEKIEFKFNRGFLLCKVTSFGKDQLTVNAGSGAVFPKEEKEKPEKDTSRVKPAKAEETGKLIKDLHTGKLGGLTGKLLVDFTSIGILTLTLSGLHLWAWLRLRRWAA
jgi:hypothetical protein